MMKQRLIALLMLLLLVLSACAQQSEPEIPTETTPPADPPVTTTLMVYMIGSDLEAKTAAGTADLEEIAASGVDLTSTNVLVYAGGTPYWHNDVADGSCNTILQLTDSGFTAVHSEPAVSMGEPDTLTGFLEYCHSNYSTEQYALILWNHGSGPVRGYGQDLVFEGGSLLLSEMEQALAASPFGPENKLAFVGFDACLMASAELACIWDDYARYMVSSQEVEPSIGWNYRFVNTVSNPDTSAMLAALTEDYLASCEAYYKEKEYDHRDTTLSCVDLSLASELEAAIDDLFDRAVEDVNLMYDRLSALRVQTRAFGRATTGSEYDLVDLGDAAKQLLELYPEEAARLQQVLDRMVISNASNTELCSGLSLYYPFYNKDYFFRSIRGSESWQTTYQNLGLFPAYQQYLEKYQQIWSGTDRLEDAAQSALPTEEDGVYSLQLTEEQAACYASAKYYILHRESAELYTSIFVSSDVTNHDGRLVANFDGNVIYAQDKFMNSIIPVVMETDRIGDLSYYTIPVALDNQIPYTSKYLDDEFRSESYRYYLVLDKSTQDLSVSALLPYDEDPEVLTGGKLEDADDSQWTTALFYNLPHRYLTRDESGLILPLDQWYTTTWFTGYEYYFSDEIEFVCAPLDGGEYYLMMEVLDTQGNRYCSELLPITMPDQDQPLYQYPETTVQWDSGDRVLLTEENGVAVYMNMVMDEGEMCFTLELENNNDFAANLQANDLVCNRSISSDAYYGSIHAEPGQAAWFNFLTSLGLAEECGALEELTSLSFRFNVRDEVTGAFLIEPQIFHLDLSAEMTETFRTSYHKISYDQVPFLGALAKEQVLHSSDDLEVTLLGLGTNEEEYVGALRGVVKVENRTGEPMTVDCDGAVVNGLYIRNSIGSVNIPAGHSTYLELEMSGYRFEEYEISQIESLELLLRVIRGQYVFTGFSEPLWCPVELSQAGTDPEPFREAEQVIFDKKGIRVAVDPPEQRSTATEWNLTVYNGSNYSIKVDIINTSVNGAPTTLDHIGEAQAGPGQYGTGYLYCNTTLEEIEEISFTIQVLDIYEESVLFTDEEVITLYPNTPTGG